MATTPLRLVTNRDREILTALDHVPLTAAQLQKFSRTFALPFTTERRVRERLQRLWESGWVHRWPYATAGQGAPNYYKLSRLGFQLIHGEEAAPPTKRAFGPVGFLKQEHTRALADFIVHTAVAAHQSGFRFTEFYRENTLRLQVEEESLFPDAAFQLIDAQGTAFNFFTEIDRSSERIRSDKDTESWDRKIRFYDRWQDGSKTRVRVLIIGIRESDRIGRILDTAARFMRNPDRSLFYAIALPMYIQQNDSLRRAVFRDHHQKPTALVPKRSNLQPAWSPLPMRGLPPCNFPSLST